MLQNFKNMNKSLLIKYLIVSTGELFAWVQLVHKYTRRICAYAPTTPKTIFASLRTRRQDIPPGMNCKLSYFPYRSLNAIVEKSQKLSFAVDTTTDL